MEIDRMMDAILLRTDLLVVAVYMTAMLAIAWRVSSGSRDVEGYTVGGRSVPGWAVGLSVLGTFLSSITFLGLPAKIYKQGNWNAFVFGLALPVAALVATIWFVPLYRRGKRLSAYELLEERFGYWARLYADISYLILQLIRIGTVLLLVAFAVEPMLGWDSAPSSLEHLDATQWKTAKIVGILIGLGLLVIVYDTIGGIRAVIWTDVVQVFVLTIGVCWCLAVLVFGWEGGAGGFFADLPTERLSLGEWQNFSQQTIDVVTAGGQTVRTTSLVWDWGASTVLVVFLYGISENLRNYGTDQNYVQRMLAAKSDRDASQAIWIGSLGYLPLSILFCLLGTALWMHFHVGGHALPAGMKADEVFPYFIQNSLPKPVAGLVIAAILSAAMSTVDSSLNSTSTILLVDVIRPLCQGKPPVREIVILRSCTVLLGILGTGTAAGLYLTLGGEQAQTLMDVWWKYAGMAGAGMFSLFLLAWLTPRLPSWAAALGVACSIPVLFWGTVRNLDDASPWKGWECPLHGNLVGIAGMLVVLSVAAVVLLAVRLGWVRPNPRAREV